jgi:hypothetical protein
MTVTDFTTPQLRRTELISWGIYNVSGVACTPLPDARLPLHLQNFVISLLSLLLKDKIRLMRSPCSLYLYVYRRLTTFECLNRSLWNSVRISRHLSSSQRHNSRIPPICSTNITTSHISEAKPSYFLNAYISFYETWYIYHATLSHVSS